MAPLRVDACDYGSEERVYFMPQPQQQYPQRFEFTDRSQLPIEDYVAFCDESMNPVRIIGRRSGHLARGEEHSRLAGLLRQVLTAPPQMQSGAASAVGLLL